MHASAYVGANEQYGSIKQLALVYSQVHMLEGFVQGALHPGQSSAGMQGPTLLSGMVAWRLRTSWPLLATVCHVQ